MSVEIVKGEDITFNVYLKDSYGRPYDLTGYTQITVIVQSVAISKTVGSGVALLGGATAGAIAVSLSDTDTALLVEGPVNFEVLIDVGTIRRIAQFPKGITAKDRII